MNFYESTVYFIDIEIESFLNIAYITKYYTVVPIKFSFFDSYRKDNIIKKLVFYGNILKKSRIFQLI